MSQLSEASAVPLFLVGLGWPYVGRCESTILISPTGIRTTAASIEDMPLSKDRLVLLYLSNHAALAPELSFHAGDVARWLGVDWRPQQVMARLHRVLQCRIELPTARGWRRLRIATQSHLDSDTGRVRLVFSREFRIASESGAHCLLDVARRLMDNIATLDLYLMLMVIIRRGIYRGVWHIYQELPSASRRAKVMSDIRKRLAQITEAWPENPFRWIARSLAIGCTRNAFRSLLFCRDEEAEVRRIDEVIDARSREELHEYLATISYDMQRRIMERFVERQMLWAESGGEYKPQGASATEPAPRVPIPNIRDVFASTSEPRKSRQTAPAPDVAPKPAQSAADIKPENPRASSWATSHDKAVMTAALYIVEHQKRTGRPPTPKQRIILEEAEVILAKRPNKANAPKSTTRTASPTSAKPTQPRGIIARVRARIEHASARAKRLAARIRGRGRTKAQPNVHRQARSRSWSGCVGRPFGPVVIVLHLLINDWLEPLLPGMVAQVHQRFGQARMLEMEEKTGSCFVNVNGRIVDLVNRFGERGSELGMTIGDALGEGELVFDGIRGIGCG